MLHKFFPFLEFRGNPFLLNDEKRDDCTDSVCRTIFVPFCHICFNRFAMFKISSHCNV